jgi:hypothetical protein
MADVVPVSIQERIEALRNGNGRGPLAQVESFFRKRSLLEGAAIVVGTALVVDHLVAPKGRSQISKIMDRFMGSAVPVHGPVLMAPPIAAKGYFASGNNMPGWNRGTMPFGGWALNAPAGPWPYAHAGPGQAHYSWME